MAIKVFLHTDTGAPTLNGAAGSLIDVLKKCLVDGYGAKTPLGWSGIYNAGYTKGAFRPALGSRMQLWIDDTGATAAGARGSRWRGFESLGGLDGNGDPTSPGPQFPTSAQEGPTAANGGVFGMKSSSLDTVARPWVLIGDERRFYFGRSWAATPIGGVHSHAWNFFGDLVALRSGEGYACALIGDATEYTSGSVYQPGNYTAFATFGSSIGVQNAHYLARRYDQTGGAAACGKWGDHVAGQGNWGYSSMGFAYPNPTDNGLYMGPVYVFETTPGNILRAKLPGVYQPYHLRPIDNLATITNVPALPGRTIQAFSINCTQGTTGVPGEANNGRLLFDITGPWD